MTILHVYVAEGCWSCEEARRIATEVQEQFPAIDISLLDIEPELWPERVFAVPTYMLDGRIISLGNPDREQLATILKQAQTTS